MKRKILYTLGIIFGFLVLLLLIAPSSPKEQTNQLVTPPEEIVATIPEATPSAPPSTPTSVLGPQPQPPQQANLVKVTSVVDGDTLKVSIGGAEKTIRLIGIDTPETVDPRKPVQCFGKEASNKAKATLTGKMVRLESDATQGDLDKYDRLLRYVFLEDGTFFNKMMIEQGYAHEYTYNLPYKYQMEFKAAETAARQAQLGLWNPSTCGGNTSVSPAPPAQPTPTQPSGHTFYLSTYYTSKYYYCDTDEGWKSLSSQYLKSYTSEQALLSAYPSRTLHEPCK